MESVSVKDPAILYNLGSARWYVKESRIHGVTLAWKKYPNITGANA
jgi:hypothetical protein